MINRILKRSTLLVMNDGFPHLYEVPMITVTFSDLSEITRTRLLKCGYSPPLLLGIHFFGLNQRLIGGEIVCYCSYLFFDYYEQDSAHDSSRR